VKLVEIIEEKEQGRVDTSITFELEGHPIKIASSSLENITSPELILEEVQSKEQVDRVSIVLHGDAKLMEGTPLSIVDGEENTEVHKIDPSEVKSVKVLKGESALEKYGEKGKNGVVEITTKNYSEESKSKIVIKGIVEKRDTNPLFVVDGVIFEQELDKIDPNDIESITVLKGEKATNKYGIKGNNGVVEVTTKKNASNQNVSKEKDDKVVITKKEVKLSEKALVILDGEEYPYELSTIDTDDIESVNVFKGEAAISKFGERGKNGVVEVVSKKKKKGKVKKEKETKSKLAKDEIDKESKVDINQSTSNVVAPFKIFPNPSDDIIQIQGELKQSTRVKIEVWDMKGALIQQLIDGNFKGTLNTKWDGSKATPGTYIVKITMNGETSAQKVVIK
ncbi:MAG: TonB-dependent receptor plug domain-containing protein, partial [Bacteroidota bacterium]